MLDIKLIKSNPDKVKKGVVAKNLNPDLVDKVIKSYDTWVEVLNQYEQLRQKRNELAKVGRRSEEGRELKKRLSKVEIELQRAENAYQHILFQIPNLPADDVKVGKDESENEILRKWGTPKAFSFKPKDHLELGEALDIIDVKRAAKVSGTRFGYLKSDAVLLEFALVNYALQTFIDEGFIPVVPPTLIKKKSMQGMGYMEHSGADDMYVFEKDNMILVGTSEQSIGPMYCGETFDIDKLPKRYIGFSTCFRREAGSYGKDTRGILRTHQFDKVEMFSFCLPESGNQEHEYLLSLQEKLLQCLDIPYQVVKMCSGDLGLPAARKYDLEAWMPGQDKYREVTSASTTTDYQARRLKIKCQRNGEKSFVHMLNATAYAIGRTIIAILENYQQKDGSVVIPKVLQKYMGKKTIAKPTS